MVGGRKKLACAHVQGALREAHWLDFTKVSINPADVVSDPLDAWEASTPAHASDGTVGAGICVPTFV